MNNVRRGRVNSAFAVLRAVGLGISLLSLVFFAAQGAFAKERKVEVRCPDEREKSVELKASEDQVNFRISGCYCASSAGVLVDELSRGRLADGSDTSGPAFGFGFGVRPGETKTHTLFCLPAGVAQQFLSN